MAVPQISNWDVRLAQILGVKPTPAVRQFLADWSRAEGGNAENNPFNTTEPGFGSIGNYNSVGVKRYADPMQGLHATAATLRNGRYQGILDALSEGKDPKAMATALANSPWGTGGLVLKMLGGGDGALPPSTPPTALGGGLGLPQVPSSGAPRLPSRLDQLLQSAAPSPTAVNMLAGLGGIAAKAAAASQAPIPIAAAPQPASAPASAQPTTPGQQQQDPYNPTPLMPMQGATHEGQVPMIVGGDIHSRFPNLQVQGQVDWQHVNPRLLTVLQKEAEKRGISIVINSGYRSTTYNQRIGGATDSNHRKGLAVDAYVNGHPIGEVIPPEEWAKLGVRSGNTPGFFKGKPDPEHLDMVGIPIKGGSR